MATFISREESNIEIYQHVVGLHQLKGRWLIRMQVRPTSFARCLIQVDNGYDYPGDEGSDLIEWVFQAGDALEYDHVVAGKLQIQKVLDRITYHGRKK